MSEIKATNEQRWLDALERELRGKSLEDLNLKTPEGIPVKPLYTASDLKNLQIGDSMPGVRPFMRGAHASMYTNRLWTVRQYAGFSTAEESNLFFRNNLAAGQTGLSVAFDLTCLMRFLSTS